MSNNSNNNKRHWLEHLSDLFRASLSFRILIFLLTVGGLSLIAYGFYSSKRITFKNVLTFDKGDSLKVVPDTGKPVQPPIENIQKVESGGKGFQNNSNNYGNQAVDMKVYSSNLFIPLSDQIRAIVQRQLEELKQKYPKAPTIKFVNQGAGPITGLVIKELQPITQYAGFNTIPDGASNIYSNNNEIPVRI